MKYSRAFRNKHFSCFCSISSASGRNGRRHTSVYFTGMFWSENVKINGVLYFLEGLMCIIICCFRQVFLSRVTIHHKSCKKTVHWNSHTWLVEMSVGTTTLENCLGVSSKAKHLHIPFYSYTHTQEKCKHMFTKRHVLGYS